MEIDGHFTKRRQEKHVMEVASYFLSFIVLPVRGDLLCVRGDGALLVHGDFHPTQLMATYDNIWQLMANYVNFCNFCN